MDIKDVQPSSLQQLKTPTCNECAGRGFYHSEKYVDAQWGMKLKHHGEAVGWIWSARLEGFPCQFLLTEGGRKELMELGTH